MTVVPGRRDPIAALENQDERQRRDLSKAVRFVVSQLEGDELRRFVAQTTALLRQFAPASSPGRAEANHGK